MEITWHIEDGYVGGSRPHSVEIDDDELSGCETREEQREVIEEYVKQAFQNDIDYYWNVENGDLPDMSESGSAQ